MSRMGRPSRPLAVRLVEKIGQPDENGCWPWLGGKNTAGYGVITNGGGDEHVLRAHRVAYELLVGPIPDGLVLDHLCRVRHCMNPEHLEPVTIGENVMRGTGVAVERAAQTHCINGHEFTPENTYRRKSGTRECRTCMRARSGLAYLRRSAERTQISPERIAS